MANSKQSTSQSQSAAGKTETNQGGKKPGMLMTFKPPTPSRGLIKALTPFNRWFHLGGIPGLRSLPVIGRVPGIRGLVNIPKIDFPQADEQRLADATSSNNVCFIVPNHPEFFTDWMLDKEIMSRHAPRAASWATHSVVNGMGPFAQKFWLKNNLIAQIPGAGGAVGKAYSIEWALKGHSVLLHPEGGVGWHGDLIAPLFPGAVDMAIEAAKRVGGKRRVTVAPVVWKLKFRRNVEPALHKELDYVERALKLPVSAHSEDLAQRLYKAYNALLKRAEVRHGVQPTDAHFFVRQDKLIANLLSTLGEKLDQLGAEPASGEETTDLIRRGERWMRNAGKKTEDSKSIRYLTKDLRQFLRFHAGIYEGAHLTQEHIAESIKRIRNDYCSGTTRDAVNSFLPQPAGPRTAHIRIPEPLEISADMEAGRVPALVEELRARMQASLDEINGETAEGGGGITYRNVFAS